MQMYLTSGARHQILPTNSHWHYSRCVLLRIHYKDKSALLSYNLILRPPSQEPGNETTPHCSSPSSYPLKANFFFAVRRFCGIGLRLP